MKIVTEPPKTGETFLVTHGQDKFFHTHKVKWLKDEEAFWADRFDNGHGDYVHDEELFFKHMMIIVSDT